jgi:hypothetical protein
MLIAYAVAATPRDIALPALSRRIEASRLTAATCPLAFVAEPHAP